MSTPMDTVAPAIPPAQAPPRKRWPWIALAAVVLAIVAALSVLMALGDRSTIEPLTAALPCGPHDTDAAAEQRARKRLASLHPTGRYIVIDSYRNRLRVYDGETLLREAVCSTGSGTVLVHPSGKRSWTFDTPLGERRVIRKVRDPVWSKPDWAFIEEGFQPPNDPSLRIDRVSLGDFALYLGDGYIIHGTLFQTLLGQGVTHGCVRLGDEDLEYVYRAIPVGARVYLH